MNSLDSGTTLKGGISGSTLKIIAIISMAIDHTGAGVVERALEGGYYSDTLQKIYLAMRDVGRIAFPIFVFLLVEGFLHTRSKAKYALRLFIFALISEIPFDLAIFDQTFYWGHQNVFFTLFLGLMTIWGIDTVEQSEMAPGIKALLLMIIGFAGILTGYFIKTDYKVYGVLAIVLMYFFRQVRGLQILSGCILFGIYELPAIVAYLPIAFYNGKRGLKIKYFFYIFYPAHLLIIYLVCLKLGI